MSYYNSFDGNYNKKNKKISGCNCGYAKNMTTGKAVPLIMKKPLLQHNIKISQSVLKYADTQGKILNKKTVPSINIKDFVKKIIENKYVVLANDNLIGMHLSNQPKSGMYMTIQVILRYALQANSISEINLFASDIKNAIDKSVKKVYDVLHKRRGIYIFFDINNFHDYFILPLMKFIYQNKLNIYTGRTGIFCNSLEAFCRHIYANKYLASDTPSIKFDKDDFAIISFGKESTNIFSNIANIINNTIKDYNCFNVLQEGLAVLLVEDNIDNIINKYTKLIKDEKSLINLYRKDSSLKELKKMLLEGKVKTKTDEIQAKEIIKQEIEVIEKEKEEIKKDIVIKEKKVRKVKDDIKKKTNKIKKTKNIEKVKEIKEDIKDKQQEIKEIEKTITDDKQEIKEIEKEIKEVKQEVKETEIKIEKSEDANIQSLLDTLKKIGQAVEQI